MTERLYQVSLRAKFSGIYTYHGVAKNFNDAGKKALRLARRSGVAGPIRVYTVSEISLRNF